MAWLVFVFISCYVEEMLDHANYRVRFHFSYHLMPRERKIHLKIAHYFCRRRETNPGRLLSKRVLSPFRHRLSATCSCIFGSQPTWRPQACVVGLHLFGQRLFEVLLDGAVRHRGLEELGSRDPFVVTDEVEVWNFDRNKKSENCCFWFLVPAR